MRCRDCKFFSLNMGGWRGMCEIILPSWLDKITEDLPRFTRADDNCDFGRAEKDTN